VSRGAESVVFLFSLPRSGSTLLQRILATHPDIATAPEPWIVLPAVYAHRPAGVYAEYGHWAMATAVDEFCGGLDAASPVRDLLLDAYARARGDARYFLDKTPRYHLIAREIMRLFPDARFVFLWRQPLAVAASIIESFGEGRWNLDKYAVDLFDGPANLLAAYDPADPRCHSLRYEDLVADPAATALEIWRFLGLSEEDGSAQRFADVALAGRMGDSIGTRRYGAIVDEPLEKWRGTMGNPIRRWWCRAYLDWLGRARVHAMGYDFDALVRDAERLPARMAGVRSDAARIVAGYGYWRVANRLIRRPERPLSLSLAWQRGRGR
jgi:hypothetical protein